MTIVFQTDLITGNNVFANVTSAFFWDTLYTYICCHHYVASRSPQIIQHVVCNKKYIYWGVIEDAINVLVKIFSHPVL
jgi:hypothetical protein